MGEPLESEYFNWLCAKVLQQHGRIYYDLLSILYRTEFAWVVSMDENRASDGVELREDFFRETYTKKDGFFLQQPACVFEVFLAFARRASFQTDMPAREWFWIFMENLQLDQFRQISDDDNRLIDGILSTFMWRTYDHRGTGGLFPMRRPEHDQRKVELWAQFFEYIDERGL